MGFGPLGTSWASSLNNRALECVVYPDKYWTWAALEWWGSIEEEYDETRVLESDGGAMEAMITRERKNSEKVLNLAMNNHCTTKNVRVRVKVDEKRHL